MYCINPEAEEPIMLLNKHVGFDPIEGEGINGAWFQEELMRLDQMGKKRIQVWINSPGGVVMDGYNIYSAILQTKTKVDTYCVGIAASIAAVIFQAGRERIMADYGVLMYHNPYGGNDDNQLAKMRDSIAVMVASRAGKQKDEVLGMMDKTSWIDATEAMESGLCDKIDSSADFNKKRKVQTTDAVAMYRESNVILNSILNKTNLDMKNVINKLGLSENAAEAEVLDAITNKESELAAMKEKLEKAEAECDELKKKYIDLCDKMEAEAKAKAEIEEQEKEEECKAMVQNFAKAGRIKNEAEVIEKWVATAKTQGIESTKAMIESLPLNKAGVTIPTTPAAPADPNAQGMSAVALMANVLNKTRRK